MPAYNEENYIEKCFDSVLYQSYDNFEIIVVNDGSDDNTQNIIDRYAKKDSRIKSFKKKNGGLSSARNHGIKEVTGDFILFLDCDDYIEKDLLKEINDNISDSTDILRFQIRIVKENMVEDINEEGFQNLKGYEAFEKIVKYRFVENATAYAYNTKFWQKNNFKFSLNKYHEDFGLLPLIILKADKVTSIDYIGYNYLQRENSIMSTTNYEKTKKKAFDLLDHFDYLKRELEKINLEQKKIESCYSYIANSLIIKGKELQKSDLIIYTEELRKRKVFDLIKSDSLKRKIKKIVIKLNYRLYLKYLLRKVENG